MNRKDPKLMSDHEMLVELIEEKRRQDRVRYIKYAVWGVIAIALIVLAAIYVPKIAALYREVDGTMQEVDRTMQEINSTLRNLQDDYDYLKSNGQEVLQDAADALNSLLEKLRSLGIFR